jgi:hypothetical protein
MPREIQVAAFAQPVPKIGSVRAATVRERVATNHAERIRSLSLAAPKKGDLDLHPPEDRAYDVRAVSLVYACRWKITAQSSGRFVVIA